jgi:hypothetical protein
VAVNAAEQSRALRAPRKNDDRAKNSGAQNHRTAQLQFETQYYFNHSTRSNRQLPIYFTLPRPNCAKVLSEGPLHLLIYVPFFHTIFSTADVSGMYWLLPLPFMVWMFVYDELRKWLIRRDRDGSAWVTKHTYY